mmetsp:Transcript_71525/g.232449  ORF Transcript_71525/g.232449 Transcript_71525/m.232449 type:complete len:204 (+) Transcript_71525:649-1260(+)
MARGGEANDGNRLTSATESWPTEGLKRICLQPQTSAGAAFRTRPKHSLTNYDKDHVEEHEHGDDAQVPPARNPLRPRQNAKHTQQRHPTSCCDDGTLRARCRPQGLHQTALEVGREVNSGARSADICDDDEESQRLPTTRAEGQFDGPRVARTLGGLPYLRQHVQRGRCQASAHDHGDRSACPAKRRKAPRQPEQTTANATES